MEHRISRVRPRSASLAHATMLKINIHLLVIVWKEIRSCVIVPSSQRYNLL